MVWKGVRIRIHLELCYIFAPRDLDLHDLVVFIVGLVGHVEVVLTILHRLCGFVSLQESNQANDVLRNLCRFRQQTSQQ